MAGAVVVHSSVTAETARSVSLLRENLFTPNLFTSFSLHQGVT